MTRPNKKLSQTSNDKEKLTRMMAFLLIVIQVISTPAIFGSSNFLINTVARLINLRVESTPVQVSEENFQKISSIAERLNIPVFDCKFNSDKGRIVYGLDVLWNGIGDVAFVRIGSLSKKNGNSDYADFEIESTGVAPIRSSKKWSPCFEIKGDALFKTGRYDLRPEAGMKLEMLKKKIKELGNIQSVTVVGHSDQMPASDLDNITLSSLRAKEVKDWMITEMNLKDIQITAYGEGSSKPLVTCSSNITPDQMKECYSSNRRVEIFVHAAPEKK